MVDVSIHGRRLQLADNGLKIDGRLVGGSTPTGIGRGKTFYVDSAIDATEGTSPETAVGTLDEAFALTTANQGDVIIVMPNHAETVTGTDAIAHDVAGVSVIGLGWGSNRPRFLMDAGTAVTYFISAADAYVSNLEFSSGHSNVVTCFKVTGVNAWIDACSFNNNTTNEDFLTCIKATGAANTADGLKVTRCDWFTIDTDDAAFITFVDNAKNVIIGGSPADRNRVLTLSATAAQLVSVASGKLLTNAFITDNFLANAMTAGELLFSNDGTTNSGFVADNRVAHLDVTGTHDLGADAAGFKLFNNLSVSVDNLSGFVLPAIDVNL